MWLEAPEFVDVRISEASVRLGLNAPLGSLQVLERCTDFVKWVPVSTVTINTRPFIYNDLLAITNSAAVYRLRW